MITAISTEAVVLRTIEYSDTSLIVRMFTESQGKITVMARGAKRAKNATAGMLQPPNYIAVQFRYKVSRDIQPLTECEYVTYYTRLATDLKRYAGAMLSVEMLDRAVQERDPQPILFRLIIATLHELDTSDGEIATIVHFFQLHLARQLGFAPELEKCSICGAPLVSANLLSEQGSLCCDPCLAGGIDTEFIGHLPVRPEALIYLQSLVSTHISALNSLSIDKQSQHEGGKFLLKHLYCHVDGMQNLKSIDFWQQVKA